VVLGEPKWYSRSEREILHLLHGAASPDPLLGVGAAVGGEEAVERGKLLLNVAVVRGKPLLRVRCWRPRQP